MSALRAPVGLGSGGRDLWKSITEAHTLDAAQQVTLLEVCRSKDRLDKLDDLLRGDVDTWVVLVHDLSTDDYSLKIDNALSLANSTANLMKQLIASLRLPDEAAKRPQQRGGARGAYASSGASSKVSSLDRARAAKTGA